MSENPLATVLVADSHDISRATTTSFLRAIGLNVLQAIDGGSGIKVVQEHPVDILIFDSAMKPLSGFEIAHYIQGASLNIPMILISDDHASDGLQYAASLGIRHVLTKPIDPKRLESIIMQLLARTHKTPSFDKISVIMDRAPLTPDQIMDHAIHLARKNVVGKFGGPYASVIADKNGYIIGEGVNLPTSRFDPIAHAEVMAIRKAAEFLQQSHLEECTIYSTSEPTKMAMALIESVGIKNVVFGLSHADMSKQRNPVPPSPVKISRLGGDRVQAMLRETGHA